MKHIGLKSLLSERVHYHQPANLDVVKKGQTHPEVLKAARTLFYDFYAIRYLHNTFGESKKYEKPQWGSDAPELDVPAGPPMYGNLMGTEKPGDNIFMAASPEIQPSWQGHPISYGFRKTIDELFEQITKLTAIKLVQYLRMSLLQEFRYFSGASGWVQFRQSLVAKQNSAKSQGRNMNKKEFDEVVKKYIPEMAPYPDSILRLLKFTKIYKDGDSLYSSDNKKGYDIAKDAVGHDVLPNWYDQPGKEYTPIGKQQWHHKKKKEPHPDYAATPFADPLTPGEKYPSNVPPDWDEVPKPEAGDEPEGEPIPDYPGYESPETMLPYEDPYAEKKKKAQNKLEEELLMEYVGATLTPKLIIRSKNTAKKAGLTWEDLDRAYNLIHWGGAVGGERWGTGSHALLGLLPKLQSGDAEVVAEAVDHVWDLVHNTGPLLNKGGMHVEADDLDRRANMTHPARFLNDVSPQIKNLILSLLRHMPGDAEIQKDIHKVTNSPSHALPKEEEDYLLNLGFKKGSDFYRIGYKFYDKKENLKTGKYYDLKAHNNGMFSIADDMDSDVEVFKSWDELKKWVESNKVRFVSTNIPNVYGSPSTPPPISLTKQYIQSHTRKKLSPDQEQALLDIEMGWRSGSQYYKAYLKGNKRFYLYAFTDGTFLTTWDKETAHKVFDNFHDALASALNDIAITGAEPYKDKAAAQAEINKAKGISTPAAPTPTPSATTPPSPVSGDKYSLSSGEVQHLKDNVNSLNEFATVGQSEDGTSYVTTPEYNLSKIRFYVGKMKLATAGKPYFISHNVGISNKEIFYFEKWSQLILFMVGNFQKLIVGNAFQHLVSGGDISSSSITPGVYTTQGSSSDLPPNATSKALYTAHSGISSTPNSIRLTVEDENAMKAIGFEPKKVGKDVWYIHKTTNDTVKFYPNDKAKLLFVAQSNQPSVTLSIDKMFKWLPTKYSPTTKVSPLHQATPSPTPQATQVEGSKAGSMFEKIITAAGFHWEDEIKGYTDNVMGGGNKHSLIIHPYPMSQLKTWDGQGNVLDTKSFGNLPVLANYLKTQFEEDKKKIIAPSSNKQNPLSIISTTEFQKLDAYLKENGFEYVGTLDPKNGGGWEWKNKEKKNSVKLFLQGMVVLFNSDDTYNSYKTVYEFISDYTTELNADSIVATSDPKDSQTELNKLDEFLKSHGFVFMGNTDPQDKNIWQWDLKDSTNTISIYWDSINGNVLRFNDKSNYDNEWDSVDEFIAAYLKELQNDPNVLESKKQKVLDLLKNAGFTVGYSPGQATTYTNSAGDYVTLYFNSTLHSEFDSTVHNTKYNQTEHYDNIDQLIEYLQEMYGSGGFGGGTNTTPPTPPSKGGGWGGTAPYIPTPNSPDAINIEEFQQIDDLAAKWPEFLKVEKKNGQKAGGGQTLYVLISEKFHNNPLWAVTKAENQYVLFRIAENQGKWDSILMSQTFEPIYDKLNEELTHYCVDAVYKDKLINVYGLTPPLKDLVESKGFKPEYNSYGLFWQHPTGCIFQTFENGITVNSVKMGQLEWKVPKETQLKYLQRVMEKLTPNMSQEEIYNTFQYNITSDRDKKFDELLRKVKSLNGKQFVNDEFPSKMKNLGFEWNGFDNCYMNEERHQVVVPAIQHGAYIFYIYWVGKDNNIKDTYCHTLVDLYDLLEHITKTQNSQSQTTQPTQASSPENPFSIQDYNTNPTDEELKMIKLNDNDNNELKNLGFEWNEQQKCYIKPVFPTSINQIKENNEAADGFYEMITCFNSGHAIWITATDPDPMTVPIEEKEDKIYVILDFVWKRWTNNGSAGSGGSAAIVEPSADVYLKLHDHGYEWKDAAKKFVNTNKPSEYIVFLSSGDAYWYDGPEKHQEFKNKEELFNFLGWGDIAKEEAEPMPKLSGFDYKGWGKEAIEAGTAGPYDTLQFLDPDYILLKELGFELESDLGVTHYVNKTTKEKIILYVNGDVRYYGPDGTQWLYNTAQLNVLFGWLWNKHQSKRKDKTQPSAKPYGNPTEPSGTMHYSGTDYKKLYDEQYPKISKNGAIRLLTEDEESLYNMGFSVAIAYHSENPSTKVHYYNEKTKEAIYFFASGKASYWINGGGPDFFNTVKDMFDFLWKKHNNQSTSPTTPSPKKNVTTETMPYSGIDYKEYYNTQLPSYPKTNSIKLHPIDEAMLDSIGFWKTKTKTPIYSKRISYENGSHSKRAFFFASGKAMYFDNTHDNPQHFDTVKELLEFLWKKHNNQSTSPTTQSLKKNVPTGTMPYSGIDYKSLYDEKYPNVQKNAAIFLERQDEQILFDMGFKRENIIDSSNIASAKSYNKGKEKVYFRANGQGSYWDGTNWNYFNTVKEELQVLWDKHAPFIEENITFKKIMSAMM